MKTKLVLPIIICLIVVSIVSAVIILLKNNKKEEYVEVQTTCFDGVEINFGKHKGKITKGTQYFEAKIDDIDSFIESVKQSVYYDDNLFFVEKNDETGFGYQQFYFVVKNRIFALSIFDKYIELKPIQNKYYFVDYFSIDSPVMWAMVDGEMSVFDSTTKIHSDTVWATKSISFDTLSYMYQKLDSNIYKIENDKIYLKCFADVEDDDTSTKNYQLLPNYSITISQNSDGTIVISVIY